MGFLDKLKASVGIGGAKVQLQAKRSYYFGDENVEITVTLHGGKVAQKCHKLEVSIQRTRDLPTEEVEAKKSSGQENPSTRVTDTLLTLVFPGTEDVTIEPGSAQVFNLEFGIPGDEHTLFSDSHEYRVTVAADIPGAIDPSDSVALKVLPPRPSNPERGAMKPTGKLTPEAFKALVDSLGVESNAAVMDPDADAWVIYFMNVGRVVVAHGEVQAVASLRDGEVVRTFTNAKVKPAHVLGKQGSDDVDRVPGGLEQAIEMARKVVPNSDADAFYPEPFGNSIFAFKNLKVYRGT